MMSSGRGVSMRFDLSDPGTVAVAEGLLAMHNQTVGSTGSASKFTKPIADSVSVSHEEWPNLHSTKTPAGRWWISHWGADTLSVARGPTKTKPKVEPKSMSDELTREEVKARLETADAKISASEARVGTILESIRSDNERLRNQLGSIATELQAGMRVSQEQMNAFRSEMSAHQAKAETQYVRAQIEIKQEVHALRTWVLTGALTGLIAVVGFLTQYAVKSFKDPAPNSQQTINAPAPAHAMSVPLPARDTEPKPVEPKASAHEEAKSVVPDASK